MSQKTWTCGLWYKVNKRAFIQRCFTTIENMSGGLRYSVWKSMFICKMSLYSSQKTLTCSISIFHKMFLNFSLETWTQRVWHQVYKMHRVLKQCEYYNNNNQLLVWVRASGLNSLVAQWFHMVTRILAIVRFRHLLILFSLFVGFGLKVDRA